MQPKVLSPGDVDASPTMSSREIADLCEARHNDVVATIERLFASGVLRESRETVRPFAPSGGGRPTEVYDLTKRDCLVVVSGYSDKVRARIIDRWMQLEASLSTRAVPASRAGLSLTEEMAALRRIREIRLTYGIKAAQRAWITSGLPIVEGMLPPNQSEMAFAPVVGERH